MLNNPDKKYKTDDLAVLIPTKDRPQKIQNLLNSLAAQNASCGRIIIIDGGESIKEIVTGFSKQLPVEYYECQPPGQIRQRNMAISLLDNLTPLVAFLDDDIVFEENALEAMLTFWNGCDPETAGVSFNITNVPAENCSRMREFLGLGSQQPGMVLRSGITSSNCNVSRDVRTQWLCGGATVWRQEILLSFKHDEVSSKWAIGEDLLFSYPIGKIYPLYVCASARVRHEHTFDYVKTMPHRFHGRTQTLWLFYLIESNPELSLGLFLWTLMLRSFAKCSIGLFSLDKSMMEFGFGQIEGAAKIIHARITGRKASSLCADN